ncbi:MAG: hypothetical protein ACXVHS_00530 [Methanobacterium sp.]
MLFGKNKEKTIESKELLKKASRSSPKRLKELLKQIEAELVKGDNYDLQIAKTIITSRLTSMRDSGKIPL